MNKTTKTPLFFIVRSFVIFAILFLGINSKSFAQTTIYSTDFDNGGSWPDGNWSGTGTGTVPKPNTTDPSDAVTYTSSCVSSPSGGYNVENGTSGTNLIFDGVSTVGYTSIKVSWAGRMTSSGSSPDFYYNIGGGWVAVTTGWPGNDVNNNSTWAMISTVSLPAACAGAANLQLEWVSTCSTGYYRMDDFCLQGTVAGGCPTTAATGLTCNATCAGITLNWTKGNGTSRIVVAYPTSTITAPTASTTYTGNAAYTSGTAVGTGATKGYTVYSGTGTTVSVTGLTTGTTYYFEVYEYNTNACYTAQTSATSCAAVSAPTTAATAMTYPGTNCGDIVLDWTPGNGTNEMVVAFPTSTVTAPVNGTTYTANSTYGSGSTLGSGGNTGYVVYEGAAGTVHVYGLAATTKYYFEVYEYNGNSCYYGTQLNSNQTTLGDPSSNGSNPACSSVTCSGLTVTLSTAGNGSSRLVLASPGAVTAPVAGTVYTANANYGSGTALGTGYVVYNGTGGTGTTINVTSLSASTTYTFDVYEYNGASCYYTTSPANVSHATIACAGCPTAQATAMVFSAVSCTGMTVGWTDGAGTGTNRLVIAYPNSTITNPIAGNTYTANAAYGSGTAVGAGYVVYNGTGNSVTVTGLSASTTYYFAVVQFNTTACYYTTTAVLSGHDATTSCSSVCPTVAASGIHFYDVGCNTISMNWTNGNGVDRLVVVYPSSTITAPTNSTAYAADYTYGNGDAVGAGTVVYNGSGTELTILGLDPSTTYYYAIFEYNTTTCYYTATSKSAATVSCTQCPYISFIMTDACNDNDPCDEGNSEFLILNTGSYGWDNGVSSPTVMYGSNTSGTTHTVSQYTKEASALSTLNSAVVTCAAGNFIDASTGGVAIPAWSTIMIGVSDYPTYDFCPNDYNFSTLCSSVTPVYVLFGTDANLVYSGNFLNRTTPSGTWRYFIANFSTIDPGCSTQYYKYDADLEGNGNGASETWTPPISTSSASPTTPTYNPISCGLDAAEIVLPVKMISFTASYDADAHNVQLNWTTATEINCKSFTIQKSNDGFNWISFDQVAGSGNSDYKINYSAIDESPFPGVSYYRLKQNDNDGDYVYSNIASVDVTATLNAIAVMPNPADNSVAVTFNAIMADATVVSVYDLAGRPIESQTINSVKGDNTIVINTTNYVNGMYIITVSNSMQESSAKLVVNHQ